MKILITTDCYDPMVNGVVTSIKSLRKGLEALGHEVRIVTMSGGIRSGRKDGVYYVGSMGVGKIYPNARMMLKVPPSFYNEIAAWGPDIVHSQCEFSSFIVAKRAASMCGVPLIHTYHTMYEDYAKYFFPVESVGKSMAVKLTKIITAHVDSVIAPSEKISTLLDGYGVTTPVYVIPSGMDLDFGDGGDREHARGALAKYGIGSDKKVLLFVGRLGYEKNIRELIDLTGNEPDDEVLLIAGDGPDREELESYTKERGLEDRVIFTGMIPHEEITSIYRACDVFVNASTSETQGMTYTEAMACGIPAVCRRDRCLDGVIQDGETGFMYDTEKEFSEDVRRLLSDEELRRDMAQKAAMSVKLRYSCEGFAARAVQAYRETIENHEIREDDQEQGGSALPGGAA
ncbi:MAG: glycosyltransferase family 4 protein [Anaerovoracaceae bacterium]